MNVKIAAVALGLGASLLLPGCLLVAAAAVGAGTAAYVGGDLEARVEGSPKAVVQASQQALREMDVAVVSADATSIDGRVVGRSALDQKIEISVKRESDDACRIAIRVDTFGDEALSRRILERIESHL